MALILGLLLTAPLVLARDFYLMTVSPGTEFWSVYGHSALVIDDDVFGFGVFSFEQAGFLKSFIQNDMQYMIGLTSIEEEKYWAEIEQRDLTLTPLKFSQRAKNEIIQYLRWHLKPENQSYDYDYFFNNCATKIRDLLDQGTYGALKAESQSLSTSYFQQTFPVPNQSLMNFGLAAGYGHAAYQLRSDWALMAFPGKLQEAISIRAMDQWTGTPEKVVMAANKQSSNSWLKTHAALLIVSLCFFVGFCWQRSRLLMARFYICFLSLIGLILLYLWFGTAHQMAAWNVQLLLFCPWMVLVPSYALIRLLTFCCWLAWWPLVFWQGSWYLWPLMLLNGWVLMIYCSWHMRWCGMSAWNHKNSRKLNASSAIIATN